MSQGEFTNVAFQRVIDARVGDGINDRTREVQVLLEFEALTDSGRLDRYRFALLPTTAWVLASELLSGGIEGWETH